MATTKHMETSVDSLGKSRDVEVFVFHNPRKRKVEDKNEKTKAPHHPPPPPPPPKAPSLKKMTTDVQTLDLETARQEVRSFGINGLVGRTKIEAQLAQLKDLGAEIPKNWERKMQKKRLNEEYRRRRQDMKAGIKTKKASDPSKSGQREVADKKRKKEKEEVFFDSKVGKYKDGVQYISDADIKRIRGSTTKRK